MIHVNATHDLKLQSWVESANAVDTEFPIQNLPYGRFKLAGDKEWRLGVAIGDQVLDIVGIGLIASNDMNQLLVRGRKERAYLRSILSEGLRSHNGKSNPAEDLWRKHLYAQKNVVLGLPCEIGDYTDFYIGIHHATAVGKLFRPDNPLLPNYKWVPIGYHGRASTVQVSGTEFLRPKGQVKGPDDEFPVLKPTQRLDFELELGIVIGQGNPQGHPIHIEQAEDHVFGLTLFNDWSARDIQAWEYQPLGPFLSKNFASTTSPWVVTLEALEPFRNNFVRPESDPKPLPYLSSEENSLRGAFDVQLEVLIQTQEMRNAGLPSERISYSNFSDAAYWTVAQLVAHHTVNGCALKPGDLFGSGTLSGPKPEQAGSLLELTQGGKQPIVLSNGEKRTFLQDGDSITLKGWCEKPGFKRIGFGKCTATVK